ncbi:MAG TPA: hypothetical protein VM848_14930 [Acidimicrobiia bacterium]|nr:hypothetical protein [Acidimicrobiia bacterium]
MLEEHPLYHVPHDIVGRAIKDPGFRSIVLGLKDDREALNSYLVDEGHTPLGEEAYDAIAALNPDGVEAALAGFENKNLAS